MKYTEEEYGYAQYKAFLYGMLFGAFLMGIMAWL